MITILLLLGIASFFWGVGFITGVLRGPSVLRRVAGRKKTPRYIVKYDQNSKVKDYSHKYGGYGAGDKETFYWGVWDNLTGEWSQGLRWRTEKGARNKVEILNQLHKENRIVE